MYYDLPKHIWKECKEGWKHTLNPTFWVEFDYFHAIFVKILLHFEREKINLPPQKHAPLLRK
jgi:hypothetical protein